MINSRLSHGFPGLIGSWAAISTQGSNGLSLGLISLSNISPLIIKSPCKGGGLLGDIMSK